MSRRQSDDSQFAYLFGAGQRARRLSQDEVTNWQPEQGLLWSHWNASDPATQVALQSKLRLSPGNLSRFCNMRSHPFFYRIEDAFILILHGVKIQGALSDSSVHFYVTEHEIVSISVTPPPSIIDMMHELQSKKEIASIDAFFAAMVTHMTHNLYANLDYIEDEVDKLSSLAIDKNTSELRSQIADARRKIISLRQYFSPECDAFLELSVTKMSWISDNTDHLIKGLSDQFIHVLQGLDSALARAAITHEELVTQITVQLDRRMFILALVATVFLPLSFLAGLFGVNLGGMPGLHYRWAFMILALGCVGIAVLGIVPMWLLLKRHKT